MTLVLALSVLLLLSAPTERKDENPLEHLQQNIEVLTHFGERADIYPDNRRVAFMDKSFGDAMLIDLKSRVITCLTCNVPGAAFLRVMHLVTGDYILIGPDHLVSVLIGFFYRLRTSDNRNISYTTPEPLAQHPRFTRKKKEGAFRNSSQLLSVPMRGHNSIHGMRIRTEQQMSNLVS